MTQGLIRLGRQDFVSASPFIDYFDQVSIINLPDRLDRRRQIEVELLKLGAAPSTNRMEFFLAIRPEHKEDWPSIGARGCFLSHYSILKQASERRVRNILIIEDDCSFNPLMYQMQDQLVRALGAADWDMVYPGHVEAVRTDGPLELIPWRRPILTAHMYAVNRSIIDDLVDFLELVMSRPEGHPDGGPQHFDGALSTYRMQNPGVRTLISVPSVAYQRSSRSDISPGALDSLPIVRTAANSLRQVRRFLRLYPSKR